MWCDRDRWHGQHPFRLRRGLIHLRPEMWLPQGENLLPSSLQFSVFENAEVVGKTTLAEFESLSVV